MHSGLHYILCDMFGVAIDADTSGEWLLEDLSDGNGPIIREWLRAEPEPSEVEVAAHAAGMTDPGGSIWRLTQIAENEALVRGTGKKDLDQREVVNASRDGNIKSTERDAVIAKINSGTYTTEAQVRRASEWTRPEPTSR